MTAFQKFVLTAAGSQDVSLAIAACRSGSTGVVNGELSNNWALLSDKLDCVAKNTHSGYGLKLDCFNEGLFALLQQHITTGLSWLFVDKSAALSYRESLRSLQKNDLKIVIEMTRVDDLKWLDSDWINGILLKGHEAGGFVGESSSFILLQDWLITSRKQGVSVPVYLRGGVTPSIAAAVSALGVAGGMLDNQVLLLAESALQATLQPVLAHLTGTETVAVNGDQKGAYCRILVRPGNTMAKQFLQTAQNLPIAVLHQQLLNNLDWHQPDNSLLPIGQDIYFAGRWQAKYQHLSTLLDAIDCAVNNHLSVLKKQWPLAKNSPLAKMLGVKYPIVQGPMSRVSDSAKFALAVAEAGALPMLAFALNKGKSLQTLLAETKALLRDKPWGIGLLGFVPQSLLDEQLAIALAYKPQFAIIAGGRPDQVIKLEQRGIIAFLHVPSVNLIALFLQEGARHFILEGRECGGHIGPLSSFVLWSSMIEGLLTEIDLQSIAADEIHILFAGGIHDDLSAALVQVLAVPLVKLGVKIGVLMGSSYLFTNEIVETGAIVENFQQEALVCRQTVHLESGVGHASRCAYTPFAEVFFARHRQLNEANTPADERRSVLDDLIMGRLRIASKGVTRHEKDGYLVELDQEQQHEQGMFMLGQVATLRTSTCSIAELHQQVSEGSCHLLQQRLSNPTTVNPQPSSQPADIAIIGMASLLPQANTTEQFWANILAKVDAIGEIPAHRWDWRLYYDEDRHAKDKIYSKWGGFIDDIAFDPTQYGMPPKSIQSIDPMQLMALEVARQTLVDAGYEKRPFKRDKTSVILGASGGAGDVGMQYGLRAELPRFAGELPDGVAKLLPEWTEDSFAGILLNVVAGRIANRLNLGGVNYITDAACASSLTAIYQAVNELTSGRSDMVIAGGVDTVQGPFGYLCFSKTQALSPRGRCRTFDTDADGIVISEGLAMVALKRLSNAERDGDRIYAVIKGVGGSSDGQAKGLTAPLPAGQIRAMEQAYAQAGFSPATVGLFEAHGTGTVAGDTAELESTSTLLRQAGSKRHQAVIGSVKTIIGHSKASAGVCGLIKATLALHHQILPPHAGVKRPNAVLTTKNSPLYLIDQARPWISVQDQPRRAGISAFGFGGTNFHLALEEYRGEYRPWLKTARNPQWSHELLLWDADQLDDLLARLQRIQPYIGQFQGFELRDYAYSLAKRWQGKAEKLALVANSFTDLADKLAGAISVLKSANTNTLPNGVYRQQSAVAGGKLAVLFPGQGSQYPDMLRELSVLFPQLSDMITAANDQLAKSFEQRFDLRHLAEFIFPPALYSQQENKQAMQDLTRTDIAQPALGCVEAGLWQLLSDLDCQADMFAGHSYGEWVALYAAGAFDFQTLMNLSFDRGRFIVDAVKQAGGELGCMAAIQADRATVEQQIADLDEVVIANHNAPEQCIISGSANAIDAILIRLSQQSIHATKLPVAAAFHSQFVAPAQQQLAQSIHRANWQYPRQPVYSNTSAKVHPDTLAAIQQLMAEHLVKPVEFATQIQTLYREGARLFIELGPKKVLSRLTCQILHDKPHQAIAIDDRGGGISGLLHLLAPLLVNGISLNVVKLFAGRHCRDIDPDNIEQLTVQPTLSKQTWLINGSGVRAASKAVQQIGVRLEQTNKLPKHFHAISTEHSNRKGEQMTYNRVPPDTEADSVMADYFLTMRQFLETQEHIMSLYMGKKTKGQIPGRQNVTLPPVKPTTQPKPTEPKPVIAKAVTVSQPTPSTKPTDQSQSIDKTDIKPVSDHWLDKQQITEKLLLIVEDKTGYPSDMVSLSQNLEAELGIDSIKRVEIVGGLLKTLPAVYSEALGENRGLLNTQETLQGMLDILLKLKDKDERGQPLFKYAGAGQTQAPSLPFRHIIQAKKQTLNSAIQPSVTKGHYLLTLADNTEIAQCVRANLLLKQCQVTLIDLNQFDQNSLVTYLQSKPIEKLAGIIHLASIASPVMSRDSRVSDWKRRLFKNEKALFLILKSLANQLKHQVVISSVSGLGGYFSRQLSAGIDLQGGGVGLLKSLAEEQPQLKVKAIDIDPSQDKTAIAAAIITEISLPGGRLEVGYPAGQRTVFTTLAQPVPPSIHLVDFAKSTRQVILATGGARGITAELLRPLAKDNILIIVGRTPQPEAETDELAVLQNPVDLRNYFIDQVKRGDRQLTPAKIQQKVNAILAAREMRQNQIDFQKAGATVEYHSLDITDEQAVKNLMSDIYQRYGEINGIIHGAGVIEDKLLVDKSGESWDRVVETKVIGLLLLQKYIQLENFKFLIAFSSVAGRYGNSGQTDYATANELMNRLCCQLNDFWQNQVQVRAICWGPWQATRYGAGMVTAETKAKFAAKGVQLVDIKNGQDLMCYEIFDTEHHDVEVIAGSGPWEQYEQAVGEFKESVSSTAIGALLDDVVIESHANGQQSIQFCLGDNHAYLQEHQLDGQAVFPAAAAMELMVEAVAYFWSDWQVVGVCEFKMLKGMIVSCNQQCFNLQVILPTYANEEGFDVNVSLQSKHKKGQTLTHYRAVVRLSQQLPTLKYYQPKIKSNQALTAETAYNELLFHGPRFQVIRTILGLSEIGVSAVVTSSSPEKWLVYSVPNHSRWLLDPAIVDAAAQTALFWSRLIRSAAALPARFERVIRYVNTFPEQMMMYFEAVETDEPEIVRANIYFTNAKHQILLLIEGMECIASPQLNRLGGTYQSVASKG